MADSAPPATTKSTSPRWIGSIGVAYRVRPEAHAVATAWFIPVNPYAMLTCPAAMLHRILGTKNGDTRRSLPRSSRAPALVRSGTWPIPAPMNTPHRSGRVAPVADGSHRAS